MTQTAGPPPPTWGRGELRDQPPPGPRTTTTAPPFTSLRRRPPRKRGQTVPHMIHMCLHVIPSLPVLAQHPLRIPSNPLRPHPSLRHHLRRPRGCLLLPPPIRQLGFGKSLLSLPNAASARATRSAYSASNAAARNEASRSANAHRSSCSLACSPTTRRYAAAPHATRKAPRSAPPSPPAEPRSECHRPRHGRRAAAAEPAHPPPHGAHRHTPAPPEAHPRRTPQPARPRLRPHAARTPVAPRPPPPPAGTTAAPAPQRLVRLRSEPGHGNPHPPGLRLPMSLASTVSRAALSQAASRYCEIAAAYASTWSGR